MNRIFSLRWPIFDQTMVSASNFIVGVAIVRIFGLENYGIYVLLWSVVQFTQTLQSALLIAPMQTIAPTLNKGQGSYFAATARWIILFSILCGLLVLCTTSVGASWLPEFWTNQHSLSLSIWVLAMQLQDGVRRMLMAKGRQLRAFLSDLIAYPGQILTTAIASVFTLSLQETILGFSVILVISALTGGLLGALGSPDKTSLIDTWNRNWPTSRWLVGTACLQWLSGNYVMLTAAVILGPAVTGAIRASQNLLAVTHIFYQGLENVVPVRAAQKYASNGWAALQQYGIYIGLLLIATSGSIALTTMLFAQPILKLIYGSASSDSLVAAMWYVPIYLVTAIALPARTLIRVISKTKSIFIGYVAASILSLSFATFSAKVLGLNGVMALTLTINIVTVLPMLISLYLFNKTAEHKT